MKELKTVVQHNCHISDAQYAGQYTLCIYLLKMREFYRWESQQAFGLSIPRDEVGHWLTQREQLWDTVEDKDYSPYSSMMWKLTPLNPARQTVC